MKASKTVAPPTAPPAIAPILVDEGAVGSSARADEEVLAVLVDVVAVSEVAVFALVTELEKAVATVLGGLELDTLELDGVVDAKLLLYSAK